MKYPLPRLLIFFLPTAIALCGETSLQSINLTSLDGRAIEIEVLSVEQDSVKVRKKDRKEFVIPFNRLSPDSVKALREMGATTPVAPTVGKPITTADAPLSPGEAELLDQIYGAEAAWDDVAHSPSKAEEAATRRKDLEELITKL